MQERNKVMKKVARRRQIFLLRRGWFNSRYSADTLLSTTQLLHQCFSKTALVALLNYFSQ